MVLRTFLKKNWYVTILILYSNSRIILHLLLRNCSGTGIWFGWRILRQNELPSHLKMFLCTSLSEYCNMSHCTQHLGACKLLLWGEAALLFWLSNAWSRYAIEHLWIQREFDFRYILASSSFSEMTWIWDSRSVFELARREQEVMHVLTGIPEREIEHLKYMYHDKYIEY